MALTLRQNGVAGGLVNSDWWNDYYKLLTGQMADQYVTLAGGLSLTKNTPATPAAPTLALAAAGSGVDTGAHTYAVSYGMGDGQTVPGTTAAITVTSGNQQVNLSAIPTGPAGTNKRYIWRSKVGTASPLFLLTTLNDNTTTTYSDTTADASLSATQPPTHDSFNGSIILRGSGGTVHTTLFGDGAILTDSGNITSDGNGNLSLKKALFTLGSITRISTISGNTCTGSAQVFNHNLGVIPDAILLQYAGNFGGPPGNPPYWYNATSTQVTIVGQSGFFVGGVAIKF